MRPTIIQPTTMAAMLRPKTQPTTVDSGNGAITASHECALSILTTFAACSDAIQDGRNEHGRDHDQHECGQVESDIGGEHCLLPSRTRRLARLWRDGSARCRSPAMPVDLSPERS